MKWMIRILLLCGTFFHSAAVLSQDSARIQKGDKLMKALLEAMLWQFEFESPGQEFILGEGGNEYRCEAKQATLKFSLLPGSTDSMLDGLKKGKPFLDEKSIDSFTRRRNDGMPVFFSIREIKPPKEDSSKYEEMILVFACIPLTENIYAMLSGGYGKSHDKDLGKAFIRSILNFRRKDVP